MFCVEVPVVFVEVEYKFVVCPKVMSEGKNAIAETANAITENIFSVYTFLIIK